MKRGNVSTTADQSMSVYARYWIHTSHPNVMSAGIVHEAGSGTPWSDYTWYCTLAVLLPARS